MNNKNKKVGIIIFSLIAGGAERNVVNIANFLKSKGYDVDIVLFKKINDYKYEYELKTLSITELLPANKIPFYLLPFKMVIVFLKLYKIIMKNKYEILISGAEYYPLYFTAIFSQLFNIKSIAMAGINMSEDINKHSLIPSILHKVFFTISFRFVNKVICASKGVSADLKISFLVPKNKLITIYNGVDIKRIRKKTKERLPKKIEVFFDNYDVFIALGRLVERKGFDHLIKAFKLVKDKNPKARLFIIGKGPAKKQLKQLTIKLNLDTSVNFLGFEKDNPYKYLFAAKTFIFSSLYEGFGNTIIEALSCGLPVVSTDCKFGPREILAESFNYRKIPLKNAIFTKYGILVPEFKGENNMNGYSHQERILAKTMHKIATDKKINSRYRKMSLKRAENFSIELMGKEYLKVIETIMNKTI